MCLNIEKTNLAGEGPEIGQIHFFFSPPPLRWYEVNAYTQLVNDMFQHCNHCPPVHKSHQSYVVMHNILTFQKQIFLFTVDLLFCSRDMW